MKKFLFMGVLTLAIICGSCQGKTSADVTDVDTVKADSVVTDTAAVVNDSIVVDTVSVL